jgi:hypothetical protein|tara:strand:- start:73 stop:447 length:375 start_codon:yes stop_codon:yes gene_type:complete
MADKLDTESRIQQDCIRYFRNMYCLKHHKPQMVMFSVPNEGKDLREQLKKKATGLMKGVSDTIIIFPNKVVFCEFKDLKGKQRPDQKLFQEKVILLGHDYWIVRSIEEFKHLIEKEIESYCEKI